MNKRIKTVMSMLKPKVKAFGFNDKELKGVAAKIAGNLTSDEDASDEDVNAEIEKAIEAVLPLLEIGRSYANRVINDSKRNDSEEEDPENDHGEEGENPEPPRSNRSNKTRNQKPSDGGEPEWFRKYRETMEKRLSEIAGERVADKRKAKLEGILKDTGKFGERKLRDYRRMKFENDEEFEEFISEVEEDLKSENQDRANKGLANLGAPATGGGSVRKDTKPEVLSEDEIKAIAKM